MPDPRRRSPLGIADAVTVLALALAAWWFIAPARGARAAARQEFSAIETLDLVLAAETAWAAAHGGAHADLDALAAANPALASRLEASPVAGVHSAGAHWFAVLLPSREGTLVLPRDADPSAAAHGFLVLAWPRTGASPSLRALAAQSDGMLWQRGGDPGAGGDAADPPLPRTAVTTRAGQAPELPPLPPDWVVMRKKK